jgi:transcriptional regulator with XRE-family HTH domain
VPGKTYRATIAALRSNLKRRRLFLGLTQEQTAERLGMAARHYQKIEAGELNVTLATLRKVADALRIEPAALLHRRRER